MTPEEYMGPYPNVFARGFNEAGRYGINGEATGIPLEQRDAYAEGVRCAQQARLKPWSAPWAQQGASEA